MITYEELRISNTSYTNKDFISIYPELLDLAKKISPKWDPSVSNESDPGNVLLKLLAFIGDKVNYNADKNVLECFMPSATQESSMRNLCEMNGYFPKYYQSAETTISFRYDGHSVDDGSSFTLPAFTTVVSDVDGEISYSLLEPVQITTRKKVEQGKAMQGTFETLVIGDKDKIQLTDLDDNNRVYLPEVMIAQNGIFIFNQFIDGVSSADTSGDGASWARVDNLNLVEPSDNGYYFKVGFDSDKGFPYIEFPNNIADLIEDGLTILYCKTSGASGNISANTLTKLVSPTQIYKDNSTEDYIDFTVSEEVTDDTTNENGNLVIKNTSSTINGTDPEKIDSSYNNFKKTVGTFYTLTTCRDYANAIYNLVNENTGYPYVSNVHVADRRTDINYGNSVVTFSSLGKTIVTLEEEVEEETKKKKIEPYDLCIYPLNPMTDSYTHDNYVASFKPLYDTILMKQDLEDLKTISHNYKTIDDEDIWTIKNYYGLNAVISTTYKVNEFEQQSIKDAINVALYKAFNGRKVDYGYEIPFDSILETIEQADTRIKNVSLEEPTVTTSVMRASGKETDLMYIEEGSSVRKQYLTMLAKNILAGRLPLFNYDTDFDYDFGYSKAQVKEPTDSTETTWVVSNKGPKFEKIYALETKTIIKKENEGTSPNILKGYGEGYTLRKNEVIQLIAPNLSSVITYPAYTNFRYENDNNQAKGCNASNQNVFPSSEDTEAKRKAYFENKQNGNVESDWYYKATSYTEPSKCGKLVDKNTGIIYTKAGNTYYESEWSGGKYFKISDFGSLGNKFIEKNEEHKIEAGERLIINYTDSDSVEHFIEYRHDSIVDNGVVTKQDKVIIKPNFKVEPVAVYRVSGRSVIEKSGKNYYTLATNETIEERQLVSRIMDDNQLYCYWSIGNLDNQLFTSSDAVYDGSSFLYYSKLLGDNEYFAYCDDAKTELVILGSGTELHYYGPITNYDDWKCDKALISKLTENGLSVFEDFNWKIKAFNINNLEVCDMQILTLVEDDELKIASGYTQNIDDVFREIPNNVVVNYKSNGESGTLPTFSFLKWKIRSRLDIDCGPTLKQEILKNQSILIRFCDDYTVSPTTGKIISRTNDQVVKVEKDGVNNTYLELNILNTGIIGGKIDTKVTEISTNETKEALSLKAFVFNYAVPSYVITEDSQDKTINFTRIGNYATIELSSLKNVKSTSSYGVVDLPLTKVNDNKRLIMLYLSCSQESTSDVHVLVSGSSGEGIKFYNNPDSSVTQDLELRHKPSSGETGSGDKIYVIELVGDNISKLTIRARIDSDDTNNVTLLVGNISQVVVRQETKLGITYTYTLNKYFNITEGEESKLLEIIRTKDSQYKFYYNTIVDKASVIDTTDTTKSSIFWDRNNIYNKVTIGEIDFGSDSMSIEIAKSSQL